MQKKRRSRGEEKKKKKRIQHKGIDCWLRQIQWRKQRGDKTGNQEVSQRRGRRGWNGAALMYGWVWVDEKRVVVGWASLADGREGNLLARWMSMDGLVGWCWWCWCWWRERRGRVLLRERRPIKKGRKGTQRGVVNGWIIKAGRCLRNLSCFSFFFFSFFLYQ